MANFNKNRRVSTVSGANMLPLGQRKFSIVSANIGNIGGSIIPKKMPPRPIMSSMEISGGLKKAEEI